MKRQKKRVVDFILYLVIALGAVLSVWISAYSGGGYKVAYLVMGTIVALGTVLSLHEHDFRYPRFWAVLVTLFAVETALLWILFQSGLGDRLTKDRVMSRLLTFGVAGAEILLNTWVLRGTRAKHDPPKGTPFEDSAVSEKSRP